MKAADLKKTPRRRSGPVTPRKSSTAQSGDGGGTVENGQQLKVDVRNEKLESMSCLSVDTSKVCVLTLLSYYQCSLASVLQWNTVNVPMVSSDSD